MRVHLDCFPCFLKQSIISLRLGTKDELLQKRILKSILPEIQRADISKPPAYTTTFIHRKIRQLLGRDPFKEIKSEYNQVALGLYPSLKTVIEKSPDPLWTATRLAIAGNVIDFGIFTPHQNFGAGVDVEGTIRRALNNPLAVDDYSTFRDAISDADRVLYLTDNAGEIVFDRLLIETLVSIGKKVMAVVKGSPVINDSTVEDAVESGLTEVCEVIDNGSDAVGTVLEWTSSTFQETFKEAQLVIGKGQGNFETLTGAEKKIFFLFQSKCDVVSKELGLSTGSMLLKKS
ncbi:MAG: ARMT1-like domain-containing protein [Thermodesulfovibrionales bacterium]|nr:ARMT1-like domain-containing protein [Thermodesulfovibrionales bacterium]